MPAASKLFDRPRDPVVTVEYDTSRAKQNKRGTRSNESRLRIENRRFKRTESRGIYRITREMIPEDEWRLARPTPQENRALRAGERIAT